MNNFRIVPIEYVTKMLDIWIENPELTPYESLIAKDVNGKRVTVDNESHDFFCEEWDTYEDAVRWLTEWE